LHAITRPSDTDSGSRPSPINSRYLHSCRRPRHQPIPTGRDGMPNTFRAPSGPALGDGRDTPVVATTVRVERRGHDAARGHAVVATLGQRALAGADFSQLLNETVILVADTLKEAVVLVCEVATDG